MSLFNVFILAIVQGLAELLPVSSSAHVVVVEKLMGLDPSSPPMTLLLVMLHTGTMFAVIAYFWKQWRGTYFSSAAAFQAIAVRLVVATAITGIIGFALKEVIERTALRDVPHSEIEDLFGHLEFIAPALAAVGVLILVAGLRENRLRRAAGPDTGEVSVLGAGIIGAGVHWRATACIGTSIYGAKAFLSDHRRGGFKYVDQSMVELVPE